MIRMAESEAPRSMVLSKQASTSMNNKPESSKPAPSIASRPNITQRPATQKHNPPPTRTSLPTGQQFSVPKPRPVSGGVTAAPKRKREEYSMFQPKKKRV